MFEYQKIILNILDEIIDSEKNNIKLAVKTIIRASESKRSIYAFGASHAGILTQELFYRAGGMITINPIFSSDLLVTTTPISKTSRVEQLEGFGNIIFDSYHINEGDVVIINSVSGRNPVIIDFARKCKENSVKIIALTNLNYSKSVSSRHSSGKKLYDLADVVIDIHGVQGDAIIKVGERMVAPSSTITSVFVANTIISEVALELYKKGTRNIPFFYSANLDSTVDKNKALVDLYKDCIHYNF